MSRIVPHGKHKGRALDDMTHFEVHILYAAWNGVDARKADPFFQVILQRLGELSAAKGWRKAPATPAEMIAAGNAA